MKYIKQLDSLRAIAVTLVIISHWVPGSILNIVPNGEIGVDVFFVLSGFLISKILFDNRNKAVTSGMGKRHILANFYVRRILRIFPIYYLTIFILLVFWQQTGTNIKGAFIYFFSYASNIYFFKIKIWDGMLSHLWSLAVEEQFYLVWPLIILFVPKKFLSHAIYGLILVGIISQYMLAPVKMGDILPFTCFDAFGMGGLLAWYMVYKPSSLPRFFRVVKFVALLALGFFIISLVQHKENIIPSRTLISAMALWIIFYLVQKRDSNAWMIRYFFNNKWLIFLGRISYGIYLYHNIIPRMLNINLLNKYINPLLPDFLYKQHWTALYLAENTVMLILISWLSYVLIEKRFLNLKKYFRYQNKDAPGKLTTKLITQYP